MVTTHQQKKRSVPNTEDEHPTQTLPTSDMHNRVRVRNITNLDQYNTSN
jgi:hypothetical protein